MQHLRSSAKNEEPILVYLVVSKTGTLYMGIASNAEPKHHLVPGSEKVAVQARDGTDLNGDSFGQVASSGIVNRNWVGVLRYAQDDTSKIETE